MYGYNQWPKAAAVAPDKFIDPASSAQLSYNYPQYYSQSVGLTSPPSTELSQWPGAAAATHSSLEPNVGNNFGELVSWCWRNLKPGVNRWSVDCGLSPKFPQPTIDGITVGGNSNTAFNVHPPNSSRRKSLPSGVAIGLGVSKPPSYAFEEMFDHAEEN